MDKEALEYYLTEIGQQKRLTVEEERALARKIQEGDLEALDKLTTSNLKFVVSIAGQYKGQGAPVDKYTFVPDLNDLVSEGNIGLLKAARKYDPTRGKRFAPFAAPYVRCAIEKAIKRMNAKQAPKRLTGDRGDQLRQGGEETDELTTTQSDNEQILKTIGRLNNREQQVIISYYGIGTDKLTMAELAEQTGLKRERIRQIRDKALRKMKKVKE